MANKPQPISVIPAVRVADACPRGQRAGLVPETLVFQQAAGNGEESSVTFVPLDHVGAIISHVPTNRIGDRGRKNQAKPLAHYVGSRSGPVLVRAPYRDPAQAMRGARALLASCRRNGSTCHCVVAVSSAVFSKLEAQAVLSDEGCIRHLSPTLQILRDQCADLKIPASLLAEFRGSSLHADWVRRLIVLAARSDQPVLILGETGTGKEIVARQIHDLGPLASGPFQAVNCAGISENLLESELFGHVKGAFSGAIRNKPGFWTLARNGTLFLDEVGDLNPTHQAKILRALESRKYTPVGAEQEIFSNARILAATNRDLPAMIRAGTFREDLYYRLFAFRIRTPSISAHPEDVPELAFYLWGKIKGSRPLPAPVLRLLASMPWPGNVRELRSFLNHLNLFANRKPVTTALALAVLAECRGMVPGLADS
jgi:transcriptional regulator with GAF, ATPase, and Fis domain